jgi:hypothetical protein
MRVTDVVLEPKGKVGMSPDERIALADTLLEPRDTQRCVALITTGGPGPTPREAPETFGRVGDGSGRDLRPLLLRANPAVFPLDSRVSHA